MKKKYSTPQQTAILFAPAAMLAASEPAQHDEYIDSPQLSNDREWSSEEWGEE